MNGLRGEFKYNFAKLEVAERQLKGAWYEIVN